VPTATQVVVSGYDKQSWPGGANIRSLRKPSLQGKGIRYKVSTCGASGKTGAK